jgi:hypothetical protein
MRNYQKLKTLHDYGVLDAPEAVGIPSIIDNHLCSLPEEQMILRMLVRPKYAINWMIPNELQWLSSYIYWLYKDDMEATGIVDSWCYVTVRRGPVNTKTDDEWHFDGASFRTDLIPERNYIWVDNYGPQYKLGGLSFPLDFDPTKHNLFKFAESQTRDNEILTAPTRTWLRINPFCLHRRNPQATGHRTFVRVCFTDIEGRDINNTSNPLLSTPAFGRDPVKSFRNNLFTYESSK